MDKRTLFSVFIKKCEFICATMTPKLSLIAPKNQGKTTLILMKKDLISNDNVYPMSRTKLDRIRIDMLN